MRWCVWISFNFFKIFLRFRKYCFRRKNRGYKRKTISSITWKIFESDMESCYKNISKIRNIPFITNFFLNVNRNWKNSYEIWQINKFNESMNNYSFIGNYFFYVFLNNSSELLLCKINVLDIFDIVNFLHRAVPKLWWDKTYDWKCTGHEFLNEHLRTLHCEFTHLKKTNISNIRIIKYFH